MGFQLERFSRNQADALVDQETKGQEGGIL